METITCSNCCCELNYPLSNEFGGVLVEYNEYESYPIYELARGEGAVKIGAALEKIYRLSKLRETSEGEELAEDVPLCSNCTNILNQMDILYQEFDRIRGMESYLQKKIREMDELIVEGIALLKSKRSRDLMNEDHSVPTINPVKVTVKTEPEENEQVPNIAQRSAGPWVVLKRLKPEEIPVKYRADIPDDSAFPVGEESDCYAEPTAEDSEIASNFSDEEASTNSCKRKKKLPGSIKKQGDAGTSSNTSRSEIPPRTRKRKRKGMKQMEDNPVYNPPERRPKPKYLRTDRFQKRKEKHPYPCLYCLSDFDAELDRVNHLRQIHCTEIRSVICPPCGKLFVDDTKKKNHERRCNLVWPTFQKQPFICNECGKGFNANSALQTHMKFHSSERPFACDECDYRGKTKGSINHHKKYVHAEAEPVECTECHKMMKSQLVFESHFKKMHTQEGLEKYKKMLERVSIEGYEKRKKNRVTTTFCSECDIDFQTVNRYIIHRNEFHCKKQWQCEQCGKEFTSREVFKRHMQYVHTDERPYVCEHCGKRFKSPKNLQTHVGRAHAPDGKLKMNEYYRENQLRKKKLAEELNKKAKQTTDNSLETGMKHSSVLRSSYHL